MKIKLNTSLAGPGYVFGYGDIVDAPAEVAKRLIERDQAEVVSNTAKSVGDIPVAKKAKAPARKKATKPTRNKGQ
ncbi:MAG: hypothetical protein DBP02_15165 [gamma proteobacterium symbiont of Ctena orbiculata]|nr:MAG: hypothetical protein DBP02_15165 [gamma proteobacterium symbiont of Ctena orbiculata]